MKFKLPFLVFLLSTLFAFSQDDNNSFKMLDNAAIDSDVYDLKYKAGSENFKIKIIKGKKEALSDDFAWDVDASLLAKAIVQTVKEGFGKTNLKFEDLDDTEREHLLKLKTKVLERKRASLSVEQQTLYDIDRAKDQYSGKLVLRKFVPIINSEKDPIKLNKEEIERCKEGDTQETFLMAINKLNAIKDPDLLYDDLTKVNEEIDSGTETATVNQEIKEEAKKNTVVMTKALVQFFNNKASTIYLEGYYKGEKVIFVNSEYSVPIRWFNRYGMTVSTLTSKCERITISYNDVFNYESDQFFNYSIANDQVKLSTGSPEKSSIAVKQRRFFDFFTAVIYSDVLGFNSNNSNSLINAQATLLVPMNLGNLKKLSATRQFITSVNVSLSNNFDDETRYIRFQDSANVSHFDLYRKRNINAELLLDLLTYESKGWFLNTSLGYRAGFNRTGYRYSPTDTTSLDNVIDGQVFSASHGPYLNFEFRPQINFGADISFNYEFLQYNDSVALNERDFGDEILTGKGDLINVSAKFYWLTNPEKSVGGVYANLATTYHMEADAIFPQIMVGYATNLTSFVNRFKPKDK